MKNFLLHVRLLFPVVGLRVQFPLFSTGFIPVENFTPQHMASFNSRLGASQRKFPRKKALFILLIACIVLLFLLVLLKAKQNRISTVSSNINGLQNQAINKDGRQIINREFAFPIRNDANKELSNIMYAVESAELKNEIYVKGELAKAIKGRVFLIINLKITNKEKRGLQIRTRDYIRLGVNMHKEWLAPDIHNDPVEVQAISTKYTRVGFIINETDKNLALQIGEIDGVKETISLSLK